MKKIILITGASSGIGKEAALMLLNEGHVVYAAARRLGLMNDIQDAGGIPVSLDITKENDLLLCVGKIIQEQGKIDVLINNAGFGLYGAMEETTIEEAKYQFEVNFFCLARLTQLVLPHMRKQKSGRIINISSMAGKMYMPLGSWYHASKHALEAWSDCLRVEVKQLGIQVVIIEPGIIGTEFENVMLEPMLKRSESSPYRNLTDAMVNSTQKNYNQKGSFSHVSVVSKAISKSIKSKRPKTRYAIGKLSKLSIFVRTYFGDRFFDYLLSKQIK